MIICRMQVRCIFLCPCVHPSCSGFDRQNNLIFSGPCCGRFNENVNVVGVVWHNNSYTAVGESEDNNNVCAIFRHDKYFVRSTRSIWYICNELDMTAKSTYLPPVFHIIWYHMMRPFSSIVTFMFNKLSVCTVVYRILKSRHDCKSYYWLIVEIWLENASKQAAPLSVSHTPPAFVGEGSATTLTTSLSVRRLVVPNMSVRQRSALQNSCQQRPVWLLLLCNHSIRYHSRNCTGQEADSRTSQEQSMQRSICRGPVIENQLRVRDMHDGQ